MLARCSTGLLKTLRCRHQTVAVKSFCAASISNFDALGKNYVISKTDPELSFHHGRIGHLTESSVLCRHRDTVVHIALASKRNADATSDFLPLTVEFRNRQSASGFIPDTPIRRERGSSDEEVLAARVIDRTVRPLFPKGYVDEVNITVTTQSTDGIRDPLVAAVNGASYALLRSNQPWFGPIGCVRIGYVDGALVVDPTVQQLEDSTLDLVFAGTADRTLMIETISQQFPEELMCKALELAQLSVKDVINTQLEAISEEAAEVKEAESEGFVAATPKFVKGYFTPPEQMTSDLAAFGFEEALVLYSNNGTLTKRERTHQEGYHRSQLAKWLEAHEQWGVGTEYHAVERAMAVESVMSTAIRKVLLQGQRVDGRDRHTIRPIASNADVLPVVHGSAFFERGDTHVLCTATLGSNRMSRRVIPIQTNKERLDNFYLHYDFPPYCTGDIGNATLLNRRMVGHGNLAEKALRPVMPPFSSFPYSIRVTSECTSSQGSSSMATVCGATLALLDAGVPLIAPVAGVSIGLVTEESEDPLTTDLQHMLLTDILGMEDHYGDMDFKIAGTRQGITAMQLDVKLHSGIPLPILLKALDKARIGRNNILDIMGSASATNEVANPLLCKPLKDYSPRAEVIMFDPERKKSLMGPYGETITQIREHCQVDLDADTQGMVYIFGRNKHNVNIAKQLINDLVADVTVGSVYEAEITEVRDFGATCKLTRSQEAILHVSEISWDPSVSRQPMTDLMAVGQKVDVKVLMVDKSTGQVKVSRKRQISEYGYVVDPLTKASSPLPDDVLTAKAPEVLNESEALASMWGDIQPFPITPPRKWDKQYFREQVASPGAIAETLRKQQGNTPVPGGSTT